VNPLRCPRLWTRLMAALVIVAGSWLLLVPITAVYVMNDGTGDVNRGPDSIAVLYSWWTSDEVLVYSDAGLTQTPHVVEGVRLGCGNSFTSGLHEQLVEGAHGPWVCSTVKAPRRILGLVLAVLGMASVLLSSRVPDESARYRNRYRQPYSQRRALRRGR
jgi:hypothetical protein